MNALFDFEDQPQEPKPLADWAGNEMPVKKPIESDNPMVVLHDRGPSGKKCKDCKFILWDYYHNKHTSNARREA